jgi:hypothetical protein
LTTVTVVLFHHFIFPLPEKKKNQKQSMEGEDTARNDKNKGRSWYDPIYTMDRSDGIGRVLYQDGFDVIWSIYVSKGCRLIHYHGSVGRLFKSISQNNEHISWPENA